MRTLAARAMERLSCSSWLLAMPGSSAETTTRPPFTPMYEEEKNGSAATFSPTCFMVTRARTPASPAPTATS